MNANTLILASASPRRKELLEGLGLEFQVIPTGVEESQGEHLTATETAQLNAYRKARAIAKKYPDAVVLGVDTVVALGSRMFGKPATLKDAEEMIFTLQGTTHRVVSGVCLVHLRMHRQKMFFDETVVTFRALTREQIRSYISEVNPLDKAGGYGIQEKGDELVQIISGSFTNVVGMPMERLVPELAEFDIHAPLRT